jgi:hypothetical protein
LTKASALRVSSQKPVPFLCRKGSGCQMFIAAAACMLHQMGWLAAH